MNVDRKPLVLTTFLDGHATDGGGYVHKLGTLRVLRAMQGPDLKVLVICETTDAREVAEDLGLQGVVFRRTFIRRLLGALSGAGPVRSYFGRKVGPSISPLERLLVRLGADIAFFPNPDNRALQLYSHSYIYSILDLTHIEHPEFPEVAKYGEFERRERVYVEATRKAVAVIVDSEPTRRLLADQYRVPVTRVYAAPFLLPASLNGFIADPDKTSAIQKRYGISSPYIFYPAQFWSHKNHKYILSALDILRRERGWSLQAVFCGSDKGALESVMMRAAQLGVRDLVKYCGFVPSDEIPYLYKGALALVMPTYCGPNNIPPVEARALGVPVCYSDFPSFREQMGDSVIYVDLEDPRTLADALAKIRNAQDAGSRSSVVKDGQEYDHCESRYREVLEKIIETYRRKVL